MGKGMEFLQKQEEYLARGDIDGLMEHHYTDDAEMVTFDFVAKGKDAIKQYLAVDGPAKSGPILGVELTNVMESDDVIIFNAKVTSEKMGMFIARDAMVFKDGKVWRHIALTLDKERDPVAE
jgi:hypothetical protein